jgi:hypothetical protein
LWIIHCQDIRNLLVASLSNKANTYFNLYLIIILLLCIDHASNDSYYSFLLQLN